MITAKAAKFAEEEARRRLSPRRISRWWAVLWGPVLWLFSAILVYAILKVPKDFVQGPASWSFGGAFALGGMLFSVYHFAPIYVFGHEYTHWLVAHLMGHQTGKFHVGMDKGYVAVPEPNAIIVLAPYCLPFYFILFAGLFAFVGLIWSGATELFWVSAFAWLGLCYSFHIVLTCVALGRAQTDLDYCGAVLSWSIIVWGNLLVFFLSIILISQQWRLGWELPWNAIAAICRRISSCATSCFGH